MKAKMKTLDELKPVRCGCGGEANTKQAYNGGWYVFCENCKTCTGFRNTETEAVEAWNRAMGEQAPLAKVNEIATRSYCGECGERLDDYDDICGEPPIKYCPKCGARLEWE